MAGRRRRKTTIGGQFAPRLIEMINCPGFRVLSLSARRILDRLEIEHGSHGGTDNGKLPCTYDDFERYGIHRHAISPAIREAVALGFIEVTEKGCAGNAEHRSPNLFRLTYRPTDYAKETDEWRRIDTIERANIKAAAARKRVYQAGGKKQKPSGGKRRVSVMENNTENSNLQ